MGSITARRCAEGLGRVLGSERDGCGWGKRGKKGREAGRGEEGAAYDDNRNNKSGNVAVSADEVVAR